MSEGPALMAEWSKVSPLTCSTVSLTTDRVQTLLDHVRKFPSDFWLGDGFRRVVRFSPQVTTGRKNDKKRNSKFDL